MLNNLRLIFIFIFLVSCSQGENSSLVTNNSSATTSYSLNILTEDSINSLNQNSFTLNGTCKMSSSTIQIDIDNGNLLSTAFCSNNQFTKTLDLGSLNESNSIPIKIQEDSLEVIKSFTKDTSSPTNVSESITNSSYKLGDIITLTINFNETVFVTDNPRIEVNLDNQSNTNLFFNYQSGDSTNIINFSYTVTSGDSDLNGIDLLNGINTALGSLTDLSGNPITINMSSTHFPSVLIDSSSPIINSIVEPISGTYADNGGELLFQVNFSENVNITGQPRLVLNIGEVTKYAVYSSGSGSSGIEFKYAIEAGDNDLDGIEYQSSNIDLNSGTIKASSDNDNAQIDISNNINSMSSVLVNTSSGITAPDKVFGVSTAPSTSNTALHLSWSKPNDNGTAIINYAIQYRILGSTTWTNLPPSTSTTTQINGLIEGTDYEFRVAANNGLLGVYSNITTASIFDILSLNPIAWLSATNITNGGTEPNDGDRVAIWKDLTGTATDATETTASKQPIYEANVQNGLPAIKFDGTIDRGLEGSFTRTNNGGLTMILVGKFSGTARRAFFEFYKTGGGTSPGSPRGFFFTYGFNNASVNYNLNNTQFNIWSAYDTGTKTDFNENGSPIYTGFNNWGNTSFTGSGSYVLGDDQTGGDRLNGYIGEFLIFDRKLTTQELSTLETYLKNKWGTP